MRQPVTVVSLLADSSIMLIAVCFDPPVRISQGMELPIIIQPPLHKVRYFLAGSQARCLLTIIRLHLIPLR